jgi:hypothetical protein
MTMTLAESHWGADSDDAEVDWPLLIGRIRSRTVIPILGPHLYPASSAPGAPSFDRAIAQQLATEHDLGIVPTGRTVRDVALRVVREAGISGGVVHKRVRELINEVKHEPEPLKQLAEITDFQLFVTTGYDQLLQNALTTARPSTAVESLRHSLRPPRHDLPAVEVAKPTVFHLLGTSPDECAVTDAAILERLHNWIAEEGPPNLLRALRAGDLLFLGCGFSGWLARFFIRIMNGEPFERSDRPPRHLVVDELVTNDKGLRVFLSHHNVPVFTDTDAAAFVATLHSQWLNAKRASERPGRPPPQQVPAGTEAVFLSYCRLDQDAVRQVKDALEAKGLRVFFDEDSIEPGDDVKHVIRGNLQNSLLFIPFISRNTEASERRFFWYEWDVAVEIARHEAPRSKFIVPVALDPVDRKSASVPEKFRDLDWEELHGGIPTDGFVDTIVKLYRERQRRRLS